MNSNHPIIVVTGAAKRIGHSIALELARAGFGVAVHYHHSVDEAQATCAEIAALGVPTAALQADLAQAQEIENLFATAQTIGKVVAVVNNASLFEFDDVASFNAENFAKHAHSNLIAPIILARLLHQSLNEAEQGVVVNMLDQKLFNPNPDFLSYTLAKSALHSATTLLAQALAPKLRVVGVAPGITLVSGEQSENNFTQAHQQTPLGYSSSVEDVAKTVRFAIENKSLTGTTILVDGGQHLVPSSRDVMFTQKT